MYTCPLYRHARILFGYGEGEERRGWVAERKLACLFVEVGVHHDASTMCAHRCHNCSDRTDIIQQSTRKHENCILRIMSMHAMPPAPCQVWGSRPQDLLSFSPPHPLPLPNHATHHGSVGWMSTPLTRSDRCVNTLCKGETTAGGSRTPIDLAGSTTLHWGARHATTTGPAARCAGRSPALP